MTAARMYLAITYTENIIRTISIGVEEDVTVENSGLTKRELIASLKLFWKRMENRTIPIGRIVTGYLFRSPGYLRREPINHTDETDFKQLGVDTSFVSYQNAMGYILETPTGLYMPASFNTGQELVVDYTHLSTVTITMGREINDKLVREAKKVFGQLHKGSAPESV